MKDLVANSNLHPKVLFWLGVAGLIFYAVGPILFPDADIRQPELLPVYTLMMGLGQLLKKDNDGAIYDGKSEE